MQPKKIIGVRTMLNIRPMCVWLTLQPSARPPQAEKSATSSVTIAKVNGLVQTQIHTRPEDQPRQRE